MKVKMSSNNVPKFYADEINNKHEQWPNVLIMRGQCEHF